MDHSCSSPAHFQDQSEKPAEEFQCYVFSRSWYEHHVCYSPSIFDPLSVSVAGVNLMATVFSHDGKLSWCVVTSNAHLNNTIKFKRKTWSLSLLAHCFVLNVYCKIQSLPTGTVSLNECWYLVGLNCARLSRHLIVSVTTYSVTAGWRRCSSSLQPLPSFLTNTDRSSALIQNKPVKKNQPWLQSKKKIHDVLMFLISVCEHVWDFTPAIKLFFFTRRRWLLLSADGEAPTLPATSPSASSFGLFVPVCCADTAMCQCQ